MSRYFIYLALICAGVLGITLSMPLQAPAVVFLGLAGVFVRVKGLKVESRKSEGQSVSPSGDEKNHTNYSLLATRYLAILATGYFITRACFSPVWDLGMEDLMLILPAGTLYFVAGYGVSGKSGVKLRQGMAWVVIALLICHLASGIFQLQGSEGFSLARYFSSTARSNQSSVSGMYGYYGSFANFAVIAGLLCLSLGVWGRMWVIMRGLVFLLGLIALGLAVVSQSRSAVLSLLVALVVFAFLLGVSFTRLREKVKRRGLVILLVLGIIGLLTGAVGGIWAFKERAEETQHLGQEGDGMVLMVLDSGVRMQFWAMAAEQWADNPVVGAGSRSYSYESFRYWSPNLPTSQANPEFVHNEYLQLLADYGLVGLLLVLGLFAGHFYLGGKRVVLLSCQVGEDGLSKGSNAMALAIAGMCGMTAMSVHIISDFRTHLLANLLLLVCCAVWVLPVAKSGSREFGKSWSRLIGKWVTVVMLVLLGLSALGLGGYQLWGGVPLLENKIAKEDGGWDATKVDRAIWIPAYENSVDRTPHYLRWARLGALYQDRANTLSGDQRVLKMKQAEEAYQISIERNSFNPIPKISLAGIYFETGEFDQAHEQYASASEMAKSRERWFRMHSEWAKLHQYQAMTFWKNGKPNLAEEHFIRAKKLFKESYEYAYFRGNEQWGVEYTGLLISYARFYDAQANYIKAESLFEEARKQVNWYHWQKYTALNFYYSQHLYDQGYSIWMKRNPKDAYSLMKKAKQNLLNYRGIMKGEVGLRWQIQMDKIQEVMGFLEQAGEGK